MLYLGISIKVLRVSLVIGLQKRFTQLYNYVNFYRWKSRYWWNTKTETKGGVMPNLKQKLRLHFCRKFAMILCVVRCLVFRVRRGQWPARNHFLPAHHLNVRTRSYTVSTLIPYRSKFNRRSLELLLPMVNGHCNKLYSVYKIKTILVIVGLPFNVCWKFKGLP